MDRLAGLLPKFVVTRLQAWHIIPQGRGASRVWLAGDQRDYGVEDEEREEQEQQEEQDGGMKGRGGNRRAGMEGWEYGSRRMMR